MAVSANSAFNLTRDQILTEAMEMVGIVGPGQTPNASQIQTASTSLNVGLKALQAEGIIITTVERYTTTLTSGTATYTTPSDTVDVIPEIFASSASTGVTSDTVIKLMSRAQYQELTQKSTSGRPTMMYVEKATSSVSFVLWPVPDATIASVSYSRVRLLRDMDTGAVTADLPSRWLKTLIFMVAHDLALKFGFGMEIADDFERKFEMAKARAAGDSTERGDLQFVVGGRY